MFLLQPFPSVSGSWFKIKIDFVWQLPIVFVVVLKCCSHLCRLLVSASQDGKLIIWDSYTTNKVSYAFLTGINKVMVDSSSSNCKTK